MRTRREKHSPRIPLGECAPPDEGPLVHERLVATARQASQRAYAPYSQLRVGAALLGARGHTFAGCNVENSSFGLTICAERVALSRAVAEGEREFSALAIYTPDAGPLAPCGACRQALAEFCADLPIISVGQSGAQREYRLRELLPEAFAWPGDPTAAGRAGKRRAQRESGA